MSEIDDVPDPEDIDDGARESRAWEDTADGDDADIPVRMSPRKLNAAIMESLVTTDADDDEEDVSHPDAPNPPTPDDADPESSDKMARVSLPVISDLVNKNKQQARLIEEFELAQADSDRVIEELRASHIDTDKNPIAPIDELTDQINVQEETIMSLHDGLTTAEKHLEQRDAHAQKLTDTVRWKDVQIAELRQTIATVRAANGAQQRYYEGRCQSAGLQTTPYHLPAPVRHAINDQCDIKDMYALSELAEKALNHIIEHEPILVKLPDDLDERLEFLAVLNAWYTKAHQDREPLKLSSPASPSHNSMSAMALHSGGDVEIS